jgi:hypothetical protein
MIHDVSLAIVCRARAAAAACAGAVDIAVIHPACASAVAVCRALKFGACFSASLSCNIIQLSLCQEATALGKCAKISVIIHALPSSIRTITTAIIF